MAEKFLRRVSMPKGVNLLLPSKAQQKRYVENHLLEHFAGWGYEEVVTPTFEFCDALEPVRDDKLDEILYKFVDQSGKTLALRHELTIPIARMVATHFKEKPLPLRFSYFNNVFRYTEPHDGRAREFYQAGIELIGVKNPKADAEVLSCLITAVEDLGISEFQVNIGHAAFHHGLFEEFQLNGLKPQHQKAITLAIHHKDADELGSLLEVAGLAEVQVEKVKALTELYGGEEVLAAAKKLVSNETSLAALAEIEEIISILSMRGLDKHIIIDLGEVKEIDYYTGLIFEVFVPTLGSPLGGGGRYDNLLKEFGFAAPAVGFALGLGRLLIALEKIEASPPITSQDFLLVDLDNSPQTFEITKILQKRGKKVILELQSLSGEDSKARARELGIPRMLVIGKETIYLDNLEENTRKIITQKEIERL